MDPIGQLKKLALQFNVLELANEVLNNPKFKIWSGSSRPQQHHYGKHGLAVHTNEVVNIALNNNNFFKYNNTHVNEKKLFLAALFHDVGKIWDYTPLDSEFKEWTSSPHRKLIHHISRSSIVWSTSATRFGWEQEDIDEILHAILAHHGAREWGSPVTPNTRMAWILHLSDSMSARVDDCIKANI